MLSTLLASVIILVAVHMSMARMDVSLSETALECYRTSIERSGRWPWVNETVASLVPRGIHSFDETADNMATSLRAAYRLHSLDPSVVSTATIGCSHWTSQAITTDKKPLARPFAWLSDAPPSGHELFHIEMCQLALDRVSHDLDESVTLPGFVRTVGSRESTWILPLLATLQTAVEQAIKTNRGLCGSPIVKALPWVCNHILNDDRVWRKSVKNWIQSAETDMCGIANVTQRVAAFKAPYREGRITI